MTEYSSKIIAYLGNWAIHLCNLSSDKQTFESKIMIIFLTIC